MEVHHAARQWTKTLCQLNKGPYQWGKWKVLDVSAVKNKQTNWKSITKEEPNNLVMSVGCRLGAVIASKGAASKNKVLLFSLNVICAYFFYFPKKLVV